MSERFDPYYTWLGIPPHEQPANHYRLLGISQLESNEEVISNAADRLMLHLRAFQAGKRSKESQQLLNEISAARVCLLTAEKKSAYDAKLRLAREAAEAAQLQSATPPPAVALKLPAGDPALSYVAISTSRPPLVGVRDKAQNRIEPWLIAGGVVFLAAASVVAVVVVNKGRNKSVAEGRNSRSERPSQAVPQSREPATPRNAHPVGQGSPQQPNEESASAPNSAPAPILPPDESAVPVTNSIPPTPAPPVAAESTPVPSNETKVASDAPTPRAPDAAALGEASKQVQSQYATQIAAAKRADQKLALVETLRSEAEKATNEPARQTALLLEAQRLATSGGDLKLAMVLLRQRAGRLSLDFLAEVAEMLKAASYAAAQRAENAALADLALQFGEQAVEEDRFDAAEALLKIASQAYLKLRNVDAVNRLKDRLSDVAAMKPEYDKLKGPYETLANDAKNAEANLGVGRFQCFFKNEWEKGLLKLAAGNDPDLSAAARKDLDKPKPAAAAALADEWWDIGQKLPPAAKRNVLRRAAQWYLVAIPTLAGNQRAAAVRRVDQGTPLRGEPTALVKEGLLSYWGFDEGSGRLAQDTTKNKNHALLVGAGWTKGPFGHALHMRGFTECAEVPAPISLRQWSLSLWLRVDQLTGDGGLFMARGDTPGCVRLHVGGGGMLHVNVNNSGGAQSRQRLELGEWHHVLCRYLVSDKTVNGELWIDGEVNGKFGGNKDILPILGPARIGGWSDDDPGRALFGAIDDVRLYGRVLSSDEIAALHVAGQSAPFNP